MENVVDLPQVDISLKITLAISVGLLVGLEREFASKDVGVRTFSITALLGLMCQFTGPSFAVCGFIGILCVTAYMNVRAMLVNRGLEITTSVAMLVTYCLGVSVAQDHVFTPVTVAILMTMLLAWKNELAAFAHGLQLQEIRSAVVLALLTFVIYPILPDHYVDPWELLNPKEVWITVIVLGGISFVNYILLKAYSTKGLYYSALLGGAVNSTAAVTEISNAVKLPGGGILPRALPILLMTTVAMFIRNLIVLGVFEPQAIAIATAPLLGMTMMAILFIWHARKNHEVGLDPTPPMRFSSPISMRRILKFGILFLILEAAGTLSQRYLGSTGVLAVSFLGGLFSSASATAAVAKLAAQGKITATVASAATVLTSIASAFVNLPLIYQITRNRQLTRNFSLATLVCIASGLALMAAVAWLQNWI
jgi:uncharacterized membrane protein (DUF4010 family)